MKNRKGLTSIAAVAAMAFAVGASAQDNPGGTAVETDGLAPYIVGTLPFAAYALFASAGYLIYDTEARVTSPLGSVVVEDNGDEFTWNAGADLPMCHTLNLRLEHETFDVHKKVNDANAQLLAGAFRF